MKLVTGITDSFSYIHILLCCYSLGFNIFFPLLLSTRVVSYISRLLSKNEETCTRKLL